jgi:MoaA/NifB/PqqE/SkfB family radical SAM enzyme
MRERRLGWLLATAAKTAAVPISRRLGRPLLGPVMAMLVPTYRCNNACFMCDLPKPHLYKRRGPREFGTEELNAVIDDMAAIGVAGLTFTGGEATLRDDCFLLLAHARERGLYTHLNTNGYDLLARRDRVDELLASGVQGLNISLDGATAETHNRLRNAPHGFERIEQVTEAILARRRGSTPSVTYTFVLGPDNCHEVPAFVALARRRGATSVSFIPLTACYDGARSHTADDLRAMDAAVAWLRAEKARARDPEFIDNSDAYLALFPRAFRGTPSPLRCHVGYFNVIVDCYGNVYPCAFHYELHRPSGSILDAPLRELWYTAAYQQRREQLTACTECYWNCHTEMNLLYQRAPADRPHTT